MNEPQVDSRQSDLIDLSVRLVSLLVILWVRPFGVMTAGFWPNLIAAVVASFLAAGGLWFYAERRFDPFHGLTTSEPPSRLGLVLGGISGLAILFALVRILSVPAQGQKLQWDDSMLGLAVSLVAAVYVAAGLAIWMGGRRSLRSRYVPRPRSAELVDLIRRRADIDASAWLAREPDGSAVAIVEALSHSTDPEVRKWIVSNAPRRLGARVADMLERVATTDRREDVVERAIDSLIGVAPQRTSTFWPAFRSRLRSRDEMDADLAAWKLLSMRDPLLRQEIDQVLPTWPSAEYIHESFQVLGWCLDRQRDEIAGRIRAQDLTLLPWLVKAAFYLDDEQVWDAIAQAAERGTDVRAQRHYARALRERYSNAIPDLSD